MVVWIFFRELLAASRGFGLPEALNGGVGTFPSSEELRGIKKLAHQNAPMFRHRWTSGNPRLPGFRLNINDSHQNYLYTSRW